MRYLAAIALVLTIGCDQKPPEPDCKVIGVLRSIYDHTIILDTGAVNVYGRPSGLLNDPVKFCREDFGRKVSTSLGSWWVAE